MIFKNMTWSPSDEIDTPVSITTERLNIGSFTIDGKTYPWKDSDLEGQAFSKANAKELVAKRYWQNDTPDPDEYVTTEFDSFPLQLILSQPGCEGIRFYEARKKEGVMERRTLVLVGIDKNQHDLGFTSDEIEKFEKDNKKASIICDPLDKGERSVIIEVGGGNCISDFPDYKP